MSNLAACKISQITFLNLVISKMSRLAPSDRKINASSPLLIINLIGLFFNTWNGYNIASSCHNYLLKPCFSLPKISKM